MDIATIKSRLPIATVLAHYGLEPDGAQRLRCPFHNDRTPSLQIYPTTNTFTCFSTNCTAGSGDVIDFIKLKDNVTPHAAILKAKDLAGGAESIGQPTPEPEALTQAERIQILTRAFESYRRSLTQSKAAKAYLKGRGLAGVEAGYNSGGFVSKLGKEGRALADRVGLLSSSGAAFGKGCVVFPLKDTAGRIVSLYHRSITNDGAARHFYLRGRQGLYPGYPAGTTERLTLTEAIIDAASLREEAPDAPRPGEAVLSLYGTQGLSAEHETAIKGLPQLKEIVLFFDGDASGETAATKYSDRLRGLCPGAVISAVRTPAGADVNSMFVTGGPTELRRLVDARAIVFASTEDTKDKKPVGNDGPSFSSSAENGSAGNSAERLDTTNPYALRYTTNTARYIVLGGLKPETDSLRVTLKIERPGHTFKSRQKLDLYQDEQTRRAARAAGDRLELRADLVELDLLALTDALEEYRAAQLAAKETKPAHPAMTAAARQAALDLLKASDLWERLGSIIEQSGVVGEETSRMLMFACLSSYKRTQPLHVISNGATGQGKTHLQERVAALIPEEDRIEVTRLSEYSLYHFEETALQHKLLIIEDLDGLGEEAMFALREMQSKGWIAGRVAVRDEHGNYTSKHKRVQGPLATAGTTTRGDIYEDNMSRCFVIAVDESLEQTRRIVAYQNASHAGRVSRAEQEQARELVQNAVRLLEPCEVVNPYAERISLPEEIMRLRRTNAHYQELIKQITWLHQYQRERDKEGRLITEPVDIAIANSLIAAALVRKIDELDGSLRQFYERLKDYVREVGGDEYESYAFTRREVRQALRISKTHQHRFIGELVSLEYLQVVHGRSSGGGYRYRISQWDDAEAIRRRVEQSLAAQLEALGA